MKKSEQQAINFEIERNVAFANIELAQIKGKGKRLRSCTAYVFESENYYYLKSYNTVIAFIDKNTDTLYDVLRLVYGYTSTSAQHISKFSSDYGRGKYHCLHQLRYYVV